jgi:hypothetical protein
VLRHANTNRAGQTIENIHRGLMDGLAMFEKDVKVFEPEPMEEFRNFGVATPDGIRDVTGVPAVLLDSRVVRADRPGRPPDVAGGGRPVLAHPAGGATPSSTGYRSPCSISSHPR